MTLARARREQLIELADRYGMLVLEDDPYRRIRFSGEPVPPKTCRRRPSGCPRAATTSWLRLPDGVDSDELATRAERQGVQMLPGSHFHASLEGVRRLAAAFSEMTVRDA